MYKIYLSSKLHRNIYNLSLFSGFEDSLFSLEKLNRFQFDLPVDLAVRQLQNIKDAF